MRKADIQAMVEAGCLYWKDEPGIVYSVLKDEVSEDYFWWDLGDGLLWVNHVTLYMPNWLKK